MNKTVKSILQAGSVGFLFFAGSLVFAMGDPWTTVGSYGVVDEDDVLDVSFVNGVASINSSAADATNVVLRYNITSTADLNDDGVNKVMSVRFRDNGAQSRVRLFLKGYHLSTGSTRNIMRFDSNDYPAVSNYQMQTVGDGCSGGSLDFEQYAYYIEVHLSRTDATGRPALAIIQLRDNDIC
jgi:hypothetical protein